MSPAGLGAWGDEAQSWSFHMTRKKWGARQKSTPRQLWPCGLTPRGGLCSPSAEPTQGRARLASLPKCPCNSPHVKQPFGCSHGAGRNLRPWMHLSEATQHVSSTTGLEPGGWSCARTLCSSSLRADRAHIPLVRTSGTFTPAMWRWPRARALSLPDAQALMT